MNYEDIGKFIQEKRKEKGLTQKELAKKIGVTDKAVSKWETGAGCPDVSLLESLSKELDCSILEILKGKNISSVDAVEMDNYIKDTINYSKNKFRDIISKIVAFITVFIVLLLLLLNITNMARQRIKIKYDLSTNDAPVIHRDNIIKNINIIKNNQGKYNDEDYAKLLKDLSNVERYANNVIILRTRDIREIKGYSINDLYVIDQSDTLFAEPFHIYGILLDYDSTIASYKEFLNDYFYTKAYAIVGDFSELYKYELSIVPIETYIYNNSTILQKRYQNIKITLHFYDTLIQKVMEVGGINE